jgi:hypothetical protein
LVADGVPVTRSSEQWWFCFSGHVLCRTGASDDPGYQPSRPYLEAQVRKRVRGADLTQPTDPGTKKALTRIRRVIRPNG